MYITTRSSKVLSGPVLGIHYIHYIQYNGMYTDYWYIIDSMYHVIEECIQGLRNVA